MVTRAKTIYLRSTIQGCTSTLFLFGDDWMRAGLVGQAKECRGEFNATGITTKIQPNNCPDSFMTDANLILNESLIEKDIETAYEYYWSGKFKHMIILPMGMGVAKLPTKAPLTFKFLQYQLDRLEWMINRNKPY